MNKNEGFNLSDILPKGVSTQEDQTGTKNVDNSWAMKTANLRLQNLLNQKVEVENWFLENYNCTPNRVIQFNDKDENDRKAADEFATYQQKYDFLNNSIQEQLEELERLEKLRKSIN